ncbi:MAG: signal peptidase II [bacterium]|nr:signal peptidase II [bacterium]
MRFVSIIIAILLLDQGVKQLLLRLLDHPLWLVPNQIGLNLSFNEGVAFSLPITGLMSILLSLSIILGLLYYYFFSTRKGLFTDLSFALIIGGAFGNLLDRFVSGKVTDFIQVYSFPIFNVADICITVGFLLLIVFFDKISR